MDPTLAHMEITADGGTGGQGGSGDDSKITLELAPDQVPEQFRGNPAAVFQSYDESRREMDRLRSQLDQERAQFAEALERIEAVQAPAPQQQGGNDLLAAYQQAVADGDASAQLAITLQLNQQLVTSALDEKFKALQPQLEDGSKADREIAFRMAEERLEREYGDRWGQIAPGVDKLLKERPHWLPAQNSVDGFASVIREAAQLVEAQRIVEQQQADERDRQAKLSAQTASGAGVGRYSTVTDEKKQAWEEIKTAPTGSFSEISRRGAGS